MTSTGWESVRPASLSRELGESWPFPLNANRHFLSTQLRRLNVPVEYISYQLGHAQIGQLPFGQYSMLAPRMIQEHLVPALTELENQCGWLRLKGLRTYGERHLMEHETNPWSPQLFGPALREKRRAAKQLGDACVVRSAIQKVNQSMNWDETVSIPDTFVTAVQVEIEQQSLDQANALIRRYNLFRRFLKFGRYRKRWHTVIPSLLIEVKGEKAPLKYSDAADLAKLHYLKQHFVIDLVERFSFNGRFLFASQSATLKADKSALHDMR